MRGIETAPDFCRCCASLSLTELKLSHRQMEPQCAVASEVIGIHCIRKTGISFLIIKKACHARIFLCFSPTLDTDTSLDGKSPRTQSTVVSGCVVASNAFYLLTAELATDMSKTDGLLTVYFRDGSPFAGLS